MLRFFICLSILFFSCAKSLDPIGNYSVYLHLDMSFEDKELRSVPSSKQYTLKNINTNTERVGFGGVLVVHSVDDQYYAFDLSCPYESRRDVLIAPDATVLTATCAQCGTVYDIGVGGTGAPNGIGTYYLKKYYVNRVGNSELTVTN